jgi:hypothetical protein
MTVVSLGDRLEQANVIPAVNAVSINATPYVWRAPQSIPERQWIYGHTLLRGSLSMLVAPGASGKTALTVGMALALASGRNLLGKTVWGGRKRVWLWNLEDSADELDRVIQAGCKHWGLSENDLNGWLFRDSAMSGNGLILADDLAGVRVLVTKALGDELVARKIDVLIIDPLVSAHRASENDNGKMDELAKALSVIAVTADCAILAVHHTGKLRGEEANAEAARGASALVNAARSVPSINKMTVAEANKFGIKGDLRRRYFQVYDDKGNRAPPADHADWYHLHSVSLGNGADGGDGDNLPVVVPWTPPDAFAGLTVEHLRIVQATIAAGEWRESVQSPGWVGNAVADVLDLDLDEPTEKARVKSLLRGWIKSGALKVETRNDDKSNKRKFIAVGKSADDFSLPSKGGETDVWK